MAFLWLYAGCRGAMHAMDGAADDFRLTEPDQELRRR
jgi:hypothetical protein